MEVEQLCRAAEDVVEHAHGPYTVDELEDGAIEPGTFVRIVPEEMIVELESRLAFFRERQLV
jgi:hypothetical protein